MRFGRQLVKNTGQRKPEIGKGATSRSTHQLFTRGSASLKSGLGQGLNVDGCDSCPARADAYAAGAWADAGAYAVRPAGHHAHGMLMVLIVRMRVLHLPDRGRWPMSHQPN